jgi:hypothetical protein
MRSILAAVVALASVFASAQTARVAVMPGPPPGVRAIWVLQSDNKLARYDGTQFKLWQTLLLPAEARKNPDAISISRAGDVLFAYPSDGRTALRRFWCSNPRRPELVGGAWDQRPAAGGGYSVLEATPAIYFSGDGQKLFWFEQRQQRLTRGADVSRDARFLAWTTDLDGERPMPVAEFSLAPCKCETGVCEETCPQAMAWAPADSVSDFFFVTRWVQGQTGSDYQETALYQNKGGVWTSRKLPHPVERFLDAADHGNVYVEAVPDDACCGGANDSDDTTSVVRDESATVIFDERRRFKNNNYDVSFETANAALSPDLSRVAYTIAGTMQPWEEIRIASEGKSNLDELKAIHRALTGMPRAEVVALAAPERTSLSLANTEMIGWLDQQRLLVLKNGELQAVDVNSRKLSPTGIKADAAKFVFLR